MQNRFTPYIVSLALSRAFFAIFSLTFLNGDVPVNRLVHPKENLYFAIASVISALFYMFFAAITLGTAAVAFLSGEFDALFGLGVFYLYLLAFVLFLVISQGVFVGWLRGNGVRLSASQFPDTYKLAVQLSEQLGLRRVPEIFLIESGGLLNAFATRFLGRNFVVLYSDVLELAYQEGVDEVAFVIAHELAHIKRNHLGWQWFLYPSRVLPFLWTAYLRACEYTCDAIAAELCPKGAVRGLVLLAAGKKLYRQVNLEVLSNQADSERGFWVWCAEIFSTHPHLTRRLDRLMHGLGGSTRVAGLRTART